MAIFHRREDRKCMPCLQGPGPTWQSSEPTPGTLEKSHGFRCGAMALRLELGQGLLGIEVPGSGFCAQEMGFLWDFSSNPTAIFKQGGCCLDCFFFGIFVEDLWGRYCFGILFYITVFGYFAKNHIR